MRRDEVGLWSPELGWSPRVIAHGSYGRPVLLFPSSQGRAEDAETFGLVDVVRPLLEAGRLKLYCVDSWDGGSWYRTDLPIEERAQATPVNVAKIRAESMRVPRSRHVL